MGEWRPSKLGELVKFENGDRSSNYPKTADNQANGVPFVSASDVSERGIDLARVRRISAAAFTRLRAGKFGPGDILYCLRGTIGKMARVPAGANGAIASSLVILRANDPDVLDYVYYYLGSAEGQLAAIGLDNGSAQPNLSVRLLSQLPLILPPADELGHVVKLLRGIDDKIELNRRMNETLEATARAIFRDWFVDFGPTYAKIEGAAPYLAPEICKLFPDRLDDQAKPRGWSQRPLDQIASFLNGLALQKFPGGSDGLPVIKIAELRSGVTAKSGRASRDLPSKYVVNDGDVLFSWSGSLTQVLWSGGEGALNQHLFKVSSDEYPKWFHYLWVEEHMPEFQAIAASKATTMGHIQRRHLSEAETFVPSDAVMEAADAIIGPLFDRILANAIENRTLAETRDLLLPKLMSGEIRVKEAERVLEAAE